MEEEVVTPVTDAIVETPVVETPVVTEEPVVELSSSAVTINEPNVQETPVAELPSDDANVVKPVAEEIKEEPTAEVTAEEVIEDVKENLTTESKETVDEVVEKKTDGEELNKHEQLVSDLLDELQTNKTEKRALELEREVLTKTIEKLQEQVIGQKSNPNIVEVPDDLLPLVRQYQEYAKDRSNENQHSKLVNTTYAVVDLIGGPSVADSIKEYDTYRMKTMQALSGNKSDNAITKPTLPSDNYTGGLIIGGGRGRSLR